MRRLTALAIVSASTLCSSCISLKYHTTDLRFSCERPTGPDLVATENEWCRTTVGRVATELGLLPDKFGDPTRVAAYSTAPGRYPEVSVSCWANNDGGNLTVWQTNLTFLFNPVYEKFTTVSKRYVELVSSDFPSCRISLTHDGGLEPSNDPSVH